ncbi:MAG: arylsulfatase [Planctomycetes bacterium]|nr:arylsulfatase [Planctomycetota bacterium]
MRLSPIARAALLANLVAPGLLAADKPNVVVIFCDDLGYGDLGCFGHPTIATPSLDRMAREGQKWMSFYSAAPVCTPSRAGLMTGRYPIRSGMCSNKRGVLFPDSGGGLPASEVTIAELLKEQDYATCCIGKWHLGHQKQFLPMRHGFDEWFGIPYSNDMHVKRRGDPAVPLMRGDEVVEQPANQNTLTKRYTEEAVAFIDRNKEKPFFLYFAHTFPHIPLFASTDFRGKSRRGLYGDVVEELDWSVGRVLDKLRQEKIDKKTLVVFTSDNGPWLVMRLRGGSAGLLRDGKGTTWEGGMREPTIFWWPGRIEAGSTESGMGSTLDLLPTIASLCGALTPKDRQLDGHDLSATLFGDAPSPRDTMFFYRGTRLHAVRHGQWKAHFWTRGWRQRKLNQHETPLLFHLDLDPSESWNVAAKQKKNVATLTALAEAHSKTVQPVVNQLEVQLEKR